MPGDGLFFGLISMQFLFFFPLFKAFDLLIFIKDFKEEILHKNSGEGHSKKADADTGDNRQNQDTESHQAGEECHPDIIEGEKISPGEEFLGRRILPGEQGIEKLQGKEGDNRCPKKDAGDDSAEPFCLGRIKADIKSDIEKCQEERPGPKEGIEG